MSEIRLVSPMLDNFALGDAISNHNGVRCYPAMRADSEERYIVKTISIPASQVQLDALLLTGAYPNTEAAKDYFKNLAKGIRSEIQVLDKLAAQRGFLPYLNHQIVPMEDAIGYEVYLLSPYKLTLGRYLRHNPLTHLSAVNMGIDLCAALTICRENGYLYVDLKPENIVLSGDQNYHIADLGFISMDALKYSSLPDRYRSSYTPPEITDAFATLNTTMDTYALGLVLYQVFNNGELPSMAQPGSEAAPPAYADYEMAEIILKAISLNPEDRWADPTEMGKALIAYMQRNTVNDVRIGPPVVEEPEPLTESEDSPAENEAAEEAVSEDDTASEVPSDDETVSESEDSCDDPASVDEDAQEPQAEDENVGDETEALSSEHDEEDESEPSPDGVVSDASDDEEAKQESDWIDVMRNIIAEDSEENPDEPPLRELLGDHGDSPSVEEADEDAPLTEETAGILTQAQELIDHETPDPVVAPEPIEIPMPEPIILDEENQKEDGENSQTEASDEEFSEQSGASAKKKHGIWKKIAKITASVIVICGLLVGAYYYYTEIYRQSVSAFTVSGEGDTLVINVETEANPERITVICKDTYGNVLTEDLTDGTATFTKLKPSTQYTIMLEMDGFHELVGADPLTYSTPAQTQILNLSAVTGTEDGSVILNFAVEGPDNQEWSLTYSSANAEPQTINFTGHTVSINNLTIGETYTFTLSGNDSTYVIGETSIDYTVRNVVLAQNLTVDSSTNNTMNISWSTPEGEEIPSWTAHCYNEDGYDQVVQVESNSASFTDISAESAYTVEVIAQGMTQAARLFVTKNPISLKNLNVSVADNAISMSWEFDGKAPEGGWVIQASVDGSTEQQSFKTDQTNFTISPVAPGSHYNLAIQAADSSSIFGGTASVDIPAITSDFSGYGLNRSQINTFTYHKPNQESWDYSDLTLEDAGSTFRTGENVVLLFYTGSTYQSSGDKVTTLAVFRNAEGKLAAVDSSTKTWSDMWKEGYSVMECDQLPTIPGTYQIEVYLNNAVLATTEITIGE